MTQYQTFPGKAGESQSLEKLRLLRLPELSGKSFLDVGCNEGFFCGFAKFENAACVVGLDRCSGSIQKARKRFPGCDFVEQDWEELPVGPFDVILLASSLHYAKDQGRLIHNLMERLTVEGILVLELGIGPKGRGEWVEVKSGVEKRLFPTWSKLEQVLEPYAWKNLGPSICKKGHPERYVVHVRRRRPMAYLLSQLPELAKKVTAHLFEVGHIKVLSGDDGIAVRTGDAGSIQLGASKPAHPSSHSIINRKTDHSWSSELLAKVLNRCLEEAEGHDFALSASMPGQYLRECSAFMTQHGYMPIEFIITGSMAVKAQNSSSVGIPMAYLLMQPPGYGKSSIARKFFIRTGIKVVSGDEIMSAVAKGRIAAASSELAEAIRLKFSPLTINQATHHVLHSGLFESLLKLYVEQANGQEFALDAYIPAEYHREASQFMADHGYMPITLTWNRVGIPLPPAQKMVERANVYFSNLEISQETGNDGTPQLNLPFKGTQGFVEQVKLEGGGNITIRGWALHETGQMPSIFRVMLRHCEIPIISFKTYSRPDVQRHFKLDHALCGYIVTARTADETHVSHLGDQLHVFAGMTGEMLGGPFRYSRKIKDAAFAPVGGEAR
jgi:SAM-dependent methyltransferase